MTSEQTSSPTAFTAPGPRHALHRGLDPRAHRGPHTPLRPMPPRDADSAHRAPQPGRTGRHRRVSTRDLPVDTLRGIACILLVTFHVIGDTSAAGIRVADTSILRYYTESAESLRMPLFTFLSGLVYAWRPLTDHHQYPAFMRKKVRRLLIPYVIFVPLLGLTQMVAPGVNGSVTFQPAIWLVESLSPYWFLLTTFWMFSVVALADSYGALRRPVVFAPVFLTVSAVVVLLDTSDFHVLQLGQALTLFPFFLAGVGVTRFRLIPRSRPAVLGWTALVAWLIVIMLLSVAGELPPMDSRHSVVGIALGIAFPVTLLGWSLVSHPVAWIGSYSSGIFLLHPFTVGFFRATAHALGLDGDGVQFLILSLGGIFASICGVMVLRRFSVGLIMLGEKARK